jgi:hypothetical protein
MTKTPQDKVHLGARACQHREIRRTRSGLDSLAAFLLWLLR